MSRRLGSRPKSDISRQSSALNLDGDKGLRENNIFINYNTIGTNLYNIIK